MDTLNRRDFMAVGAGGLAALGMRSQEDDGLIVHEWGVVTVPRGLTGANLRSAGARIAPGGGEIVDLPPFVVTWKGAIDQQIKNTEGSWDKPIVYFYAKKKTSVSLKVSIPTGRPRAWWPPADEFAPQASFKCNGRAMRYEFEGIKPGGGLLHWKALQVDPGAGGFQPADGWWRIARRTDAAPVRSGKEAEKFLFYDALATFDPAVRVLWKKGGKVDLENNSPEALPHVFAVQVREGKCSSVHRKGVGLGERVELSVDKGKPADLADVLVEAGLYRKEAEGMVEIWEEKFFKIDGTRVLVVLSRAVYDRMLPIEITPAPTELKRVLIAHIECLDEERQEEVSRLIEKLGADDLAERDAAAGKLKKLGPLAEPQVRAAAEKAKDPELKARLQDLLKP